MNDRLSILLSRTVATPTGCMEFVGYLQHGYARATIMGKVDYGHRHAYRLANGVIPTGMEVCHKCDNRKCINPSHLFAGTRQDNVDDAVAKGRTARGEKLPQTKITSLMIIKIILRIKAGHFYKDIAADYDVTPQLIGKIAIKHGVRRYGIR